MAKVKKTSVIGEGLAWAPAIQHPMDRMYLRKISAIPLLPKIMGWLIDREREHEEAMQAGDGVLVTERSCPKAWNAMLEACRALDLNPMKFRLFIYAQGEMNAYTIGSDIPVVVLTRGLVDGSTESELVFVIGHELGHYICGHGRCQSLARYIASTMDSVGRHLMNVAEGAAGGAVAGAAVAGSAGAASVALPAGIALVVAAKGLYALLMSWSRYAEMSADRAGLLACRNPDVMASSFLKISGFPFSAEMPERPGELLKEQCAAYAETVGGMSAARRLWRGAKYLFGNYSHPRTVERFAALDEWRDLGCLDELLDASTPERVRIAKEVGDDYLRNELNLALVESAADYLDKDCGIARKTALPLLRKAFIHGETLRDTVLERLVYAELDIVRKDGNALDYALTLFIACDVSNVKKVSLPVEYSPDYDFAPDAIRGKFIECRKNTLKILVYRPQANA